MTDRVTDRVTGRIARFAVRGGAITLVALVVYLWLAPTHVVDGDNAEFATLGALGGRAHPTGYPAYVLYLRAMSWIPGASAAHTAALATAILATLTIFVLHAACRAWGARPVAATLAVAMYAASPIVLRMHTEAEVFAPNALVVALVLWLSAENAPIHGLARAALLGLVAGLGLGNHVTCVLVAPVGVLGAVRGIREYVRGVPDTRRSPFVATAGVVGALVVGLSTYAYLFVADGPVSFGRVDSFDDLLGFFLRRDFGGPGAFASTGERVSFATNTSALAMSLGRAWLYVPALAGIAMLGVRASRAPSGEPRLGWALLALSFVLAGPMLVSRFNIEPEALGLYVVQRFHLLSMILLAIPVASALDEVGTRLAPHVAKLRSELLGTVAGLALFGVLVLLAASRVRAVHSPAMELGVRNMLSTLPPDAIVVTASDDLCFGAEYLQHASGVRPDVALACWNVTSRDWYRERVESRGVPVVGEFSSTITRTQAEAILATGRPVFVENITQPILSALPGYPYGTLMRVLPAGQAPLDPHAAADLNRALFAKFDLDYPRPSADDDYAAVAHRRYTKTWAMLSTALDQSGDPVGARAAYEVAEQLQPARTR